MSQHAKVLDDLAALYRRVASAVSPLGAQCRQDGDCCRFDRSGLSLFVTPLEVAYLVGHEGLPEASAEKGRCPYQEGDRCTAREGRPLGCRLYFCDPALSERISEIYEQFHRELIALHERHHVSYDYRDLVGHPALNAKEQDQPDSLDPDSTETRTR